jgi:hypothetical protein
METRLRWWTMFCSSIVMLFLSWYFGFLATLYVTDITHISWLIIGLYFIFSMRIGWRIHRFDMKHDKQASSRPEWYMSEMLLSLGMVGTVIGFIYMLSTMFVDINVEDISSVQYALGRMASGMGTALWTTLTGLLCSILLKLQLVYMDEFVRYEK